MHYDIFAIYFRVLFINAILGIFQNSLLQNIVYRQLYRLGVEMLVKVLSKKKTINSDWSQIDISKEMKSVAASFVNYINFHLFNFEKASQRRLLIARLFPFGQK